MADTANDDDSEVNDELDSEDLIDDSGDDNVVDTDDESDHFDRAYVEKLRRENATARRKFKDDLRAAREEAGESARDEFARDLYSALGLGDDEDDIDSDEVISEANRQAYHATERLRAYQIKDALGDAARAQKADLDLLIPHLRGTGVLDELDPDDDDFADLVSEAVETALDKNPKLRASNPAPRRSSGDTSGGNNESKAPVPNEIEAIIAARRKHREKRFGIKYS